MGRDVESVEEMYRYASGFVAGLKPQKKSAIVIGLSGELGSGKTTFVQGVASALGVTEAVTSPTFVILKRYDTNSERFTQLVHIDLYRIEDRQELFDLGWEELLKEKDTLIVVEWPEKADLDPTLNFTFIDEHTRTIENGN